MTILGRSVVKSTGFLGEPGYNIIHWSAGVGPGPSDPGGVEEWHDTLEASYSGISGYLINQAVLEIESQVVWFDDSDGVILGATTDPAGARIIDCSDLEFNVPRSLCATLRLRTDDFVNGRRLQGRIFLGPLGATPLGGDGQIIEGAQNQVTTSFAGLISGLGGRLAVWHRPTESAPASGAYGDVTGLICNSVPGTLRSRKT